MMTQDALYLLLGLVASAFIAGWFRGRTPGEPLEHIMEDCWLYTMAVFQAFVMGWVIYRLWEFMPWNMKSGT